MAVSDLLSKERAEKSMAPFTAEFLGPLCKIMRWGTTAPNILLLWNRSIAYLSSYQKAVVL